MLSDKDDDCCEEFITLPSDVLRKFGWLHNILGCATDQDGRILFARDKKAINFDMVGALSRCFESRLKEGEETSIFFEQLKIVQEKIKSLGFDSITHYNNFPGRTKGECINLFVSIGL